MKVYERITGHVADFGLKLGAGFGTKSALPAGMRQLRHCLFMLQRSAWPARSRNASVAATNSQW